MQGQMPNQNFKGGYNNRNFNQMAKNKPNQMNNKGNFFSGMPQPPPPMNPMGQMQGGFGFPQDMGSFNSSGMFPFQQPLSDLSEGGNSAMSMPPPVPVNPISSPDGTSANQSDVSTDLTQTDAKDSTSLGSIGVPSGPSAILQQQ